MSGPRKLRFETLEPKLMLTSLGQLVREIQQGTLTWHSPVPEPEPQSAGTDLRDPSPMGPYQPGKLPIQALQRDTSSLPGVSPQLREVVRQFSQAAANTASEIIDPSTGDWAATRAPIREVPMILARVPRPTDSSSDPPNDAEVDPIGNPEVDPTGEEVGHVDLAPEPANGRLQRRMLTDGAAAPLPIPDAPDLGSANPTDSQDTNPALETEGAANTNQHNTAATNDYPVGQLDRRLWITSPAHPPAESTPDHPEPTAGTEARQGAAGEVQLSRTNLIATTSTSTATGPSRASVSRRWVDLVDIVWSQSRAADSSSNPVVPVAGLRSLRTLGLLK